jgi:hypothetical protein
MDLKVSRKEKRMQPQGMVEVLVSNVFDLYPIYSPVDENLVMDVEMLDDDEIELLDRALFATVKQRGSDPVDAADGIQWAEAILGEVPVPAIMLQVQAAVQAEGPGVRVVFDTLNANGKQYFQYSVKLDNAV